MKTWIPVLCAAAVAAIAGCAKPVDGASEKTKRIPLTSDEKTRIARTAWMREAKWGIALHYMREFIDKKRTMVPQEWNKLVEDFDVDALVEQVAATGAGLVLIGLSQCGGYFLAPNATYDKIMSRDEKTTWFPKRDLIRDLGTALRKRKIALMVYFPIEPPVRGDPDAVRIFRPIGPMVKPMVEGLSGKIRQGPAPVHADGLLKQPFMPWMIHDPVA